MCLGLEVKCALFLSEFNELKFSRQIFKYLQTTYCIKIRSVGAEVFHADEQTARQT